ncbi:DUF4397 domain-containing protein [Pedobacter fastidiosus]|uniref:DUF4397 domain-containing protein n=1 Tax=Pedobacter fastidiosus TaxID=2765361 RepID=A0ABR7KRN3_9SPHI|nr:DUF4397 domain-containing protein [Pedobacter fastidiosus]MBC6110710.1 DUF4397 domain-containing protein [Pedobacter fastidiosus]
MKRKHILLAVLLLSTIIFSCKKNAVQNIAEPINGGAQLKYFNFALNAPIINFYANETKVSAASSTTGVESATAGVAYAAVYPSTNAYSIIPAGTYDFMAKRPSTATVDPNVVIATLNKQVADGKNYSIYLSGLYNTTTKKTDAFIIDDVLPPIDSSTAYVRLVHACYNANAFDLIMKNTTTSVETLVGTNVAYKTASNFTKIPQGVYDLILRYTGTPTNIVIRTAVSVIKSNTYSFSLRGDITLPYTGTVVNRPFIDNTPNR